MEQLELERSPRLFHLKRMKNNKIQYQQNYCARRAGPCSIGK